MRQQEDYFRWLYAHIADPKETDRTRSFFHLAEQLHRTPFYWCIRNDDNRAYDGVELRYNYFLETGVDVELDDFRTCTVLEFLIALAMRAEFSATDAGIADGVSEWFWLMLSHIDLNLYTDSSYSRSRRIEKQVDDAVRRVLDREIEYDGTGGLFPIMAPSRHQADVEYWSQMNAYIAENIHFDD